jgi:hypothetical protein
MQVLLRPPYPRSEHSLASNSGVLEQGGNEVADWENLFQAVELSQAGPLLAWSVGDDLDLVCTDVATCQIRTQVRMSHLTH